MSFVKRNYIDGKTVITAENLNDIQDAIIQIVPDDVKQALLQIASKVAYIDDDGQDYYDALESALYPDATLVSISAVYTQSGTVYDTDSVDSLKADLVVTATYDDSSTATIPSTDYTLSGTLEIGTSTITVAYGGKTTTFTVTVTEEPYYPVTLTNSSDGVGFGSYDIIKNTMNPPYVANTNKSRVHCMGTDAEGYPVHYGKTYRITTQNSYSFSLMIFNEDGLAQIENTEAVSSANIYDAGNIIMTNNVGTFTPSLINNKEPICMWIVFKKDSAGTGKWSSLTSVTPITIEEI